MRNKTLTELYHLIGGTDKHSNTAVPWPTDDISHTYDGLYGPLWAHKKESARKVLEIGVSWLGSGDLEVLGHHFPNAEVHGVDIDPLERVSEEHQAPNITFHQMDGYNAENLDKTFGDTKWDIVLDDGPHTVESQVKCLNYFHDKLAPHGMMLIEDIAGGINGRQVQELYDSFEGGKHFLSFIDRTRGSKADDVIALYMPY